MWNSFSIDCATETYGCTDTTACNYDSTATIDDGSCNLGASGCMDSFLANYDATATEDDGTCTYDPDDEPTA